MMKTRFVFLCVLVAVSCCVSGLSTSVRSSSHAAIRIQSGTHSTDIEVAPSFRNEVLPVFSKLGCNSGACHGAIAGKGGFRLSLRGFDAETDAFNVTRDAKGRRVELASPEESLVLLKPTGKVPHKGGVLLDPDSENYQLILSWLKVGAPAPNADDAQVLSVDVEPAQSTLGVGERMQLKVFATFSNGQRIDVTRHSIFTSTNAVVSQVSESGEVNVVGYGESAITAWYSSKIGIARVTSPFVQEIDGAVFENATRNNFVDELVLKQLKLINLAPSPITSDETFVRRVYLDVIGTLPTREETNVFVNSLDKDKRSKLIDELLERPEFVDFWSYQWSDILLINGTKLRPGAVLSFYQWVRENVSANTPWDKFVRDLLTSKGSSIENGATNFYALHQSPEEMAENASQAFLGLSIGCAKCHNHPLEKWTNDQYYAFANHFSRVRAKGWGGDPRNGNGIRTLVLAESGELIQPIRGKAQKPTPLDGKPIEFDYEGDRREPLADWMTDPENPYFARAITNRIWARFLGVGLVEGVDDMRLTNPASNEELLDALASYLVDNEFDLKRLMKLILNSATYQRSSRAISGNEQDKQFYSRYFPKRLMAEVLLDAVSQVTDVPTDFTQIAFPGADAQKTDFYPEGTRAIQLYDSAVKSYFLKTFGRNQREITCECQRTDEPSMVQVLHLSNGDTLNKKLEAANNRITRWINSTVPNEQVIRDAYVLALSRQPTEVELQKFVEIFKGSQGQPRRLLMEDLLWSLMSSREFLFNH